MPKSKQFDPVEVTPEEALEVLQGMDEKDRSMLGLSKEIKKQLGYDVSRHTLDIWRSRYLWDAKITLATKKFTGTTPQVLEMMRVCAEQMGGRVLDGLVAQMLAKISANIDTLDCKDASQVERIFGLIDLAINLRNRFKDARTGEPTADAADEDDDTELGEIPTGPRTH